MSDISRGDLEVIDQHIRTLLKQNDEQAARIAELEGFLRMYLKVGHTILAREAQELLGISIKTLAKAREGPRRT